MSSPKIVLVGGLAVIVIALALTLSGTPSTVAGWNGVLAMRQLATARHPAVACQSGETLPRGTSAIRASLAAYTGPPTSVRVYAAGRLVARGEHAAGWNGVVVTLPIKPLARSYADARVCLSAAVTGDEEVRIYGMPSKPAQAAHAPNGQALGGRLLIEYMRPGDRSWWSLAGLVARRMGYGNFGGGAWNVVLVLVLMLAVLSVSCRLALRDLR
jgi:hypothetical protein